MAHYNILYGLHFIIMKTAYPISTYIFIKIFDIYFDEDLLPTFELLEFIIHYLFLLQFTISTFYIQQLRIL